MVAKHRNGAVFHFFAEIVAGKINEGIMEMGLPDPFDLVFLVIEMGHIMSPVASLDQWFDVFGMLQFTGVDHHGPLFGLERIGSLTHFHLGPMARAGGHRLDHRSGR